jgi:hypothetical protein
MGPIGCPETSIRNYHSTLRKTPEERKSHLHRGGSLKSLSISFLKTSQLMLYREIIVVCSEIHTKHINTLCGQNVGFMNVKTGGTYSNH